MLKKVLLASLIAASFASVPLASVARTIVITQAPPEPRAEHVPPPRRGYAWAPGYWNWNHGRHQWVSGHWIRERHGQRWEGDRWVERDGHWQRMPGHWTRGDRDGDGVPNRMDSKPNNPNKS